jgi:RNA-directed DNA polymerase
MASGCLRKAGRSSQIVATELAALKLAMQESKTLECDFSPIAKTPLQYLGLVYDGDKILLRASGIARYYHRMRIGVGLHKRAKKLDGGRPLIDQRRAKLFRAYTSRTEKGGRSYHSYVRRAAEKTGSAAILRQLRFHSKRFSHLMKSDD